MRATRGGREEMKGPKKAGGVPGLAVLILWGLLSRVMAVKRCGKRGTARQCAGWYAQK